MTKNILYKYFFKPKNSIVFCYINICLIKREQ